MLLRNISIDIFWCTNIVSGSFLEICWSNTYINRKILQWHVLLFTESYYPCRRKRWFNGPAFQKSYLKFNRYLGVNKKVLLYFDTIFWCFWNIFLAVILIIYVSLTLLIGADPPDRTFLNFQDSKSVDWRFWTAQNESIGGVSASRTVKFSVRQVEASRQSK